MVISEGKKKISNTETSTVAAPAFIGKRAKTPTVKSINKKWYKSRWPFARILPMTMTLPLLFLPNDWISLLKP